MRNVEIKARIHDPQDVISRIPEENSGKCTIIKQHDTFFKVDKGRLKLRQFEDGTGELLYYERSNTSGPKLCNYEKTLLDRDACIGVKKILTKSYGCIGIVEKTRKLYMIGQTRVHIDEVEGLGNFMELEVVLKDEQDVETGEKIAQSLMTTLGIETQDLISEAYIDLLNKSGAS